MLELKLNNITKINFFGFDDADNLGIRVVLERSGGVGPFVINFSNQEWVLFRNYISNLYTVTEGPEIERALGCPVLDDLAGDIHL